MRKINNGADPFGVKGKQQGDGKRQGSLYYFVLQIETDGKIGPAELGNDLHQRRKPAESENGGKNGDLQRKGGGNLRYLLCSGGDLHKTAQDSGNDFFRRGR